ncbi:lipopolysaccharide A protein [Vibrio natriegens]|uniref:glycosyl transferase family 90 n=1 Tax=Vibrio natriegens TaxID=691 RepID=UPI001EFE9BD1|nr:glycosyl transferase family 90 [Vibrio natriegens]MCG9700588.1 lipopolysaccharide A protein [Vibrio natriegens]
MKLFYYLNNLLLNVVPSFVFQRRKAQLERHFEQDEDEIQARVDYYCKPNELHELPSDAITQNTYQRRGKSAYFYDLKQYLHYFPKHLKFAYYFGDHVKVEPQPTLYKARPTQGDNSTSVLFKLDKMRHFRFIEDKTEYLDKKDMAVFRGAVKQKHRIRFMNATFGHPLVDAGQSNPSKEHPEWKQPFMSIEEQLQYKFLICLEGNDVASNLKWAMSSNSVVITPKMRFETWFMEGALKPGVHYIEVKDDWSDFEDKVNYYLKNPAEAKKILDNAHEHVAQFQDKNREDLVCIKTLEKYFSITNR